MGTIEAEYPLSPMQQGLLFHALATPSSGAYVVQVVCRIGADVDPAALERAWRLVVQRHPVLRTAFMWNGVEPLQRVYRDVPCTLERHDWRELEPCAQQTYLDADRRRGFDPAAAPLMRIALCDVAGGERLMVWTHHHLLLDDRARAAVLTDVARLYAAACEGREADLPAPPSYGEYIGSLGTRAPERAAEFWVSVLGDLDGVAGSIAHDRESAHGAEGEHGTCRLDLPAGVPAALERIGRERGVTTDVLVQAAWSVLLSRYSGQQSVVFGATRSCRCGFDRIGEVVGLVMNTLPHRVDIDPGEPFALLVDRLRAQHEAVDTYRDTPLLKIREWAGAPGGTALFDTVIAFEARTLDDALANEGIALWQRGVQRFVDTQYAFAVTGYTTPELQIEIHYRRDLFTDAAAERLAGHLVTLLDAIATQPQARCADLSLVTAKERHQLLTVWNDTAHDVPATTLPALFAAQAARTPDAVALICGDEQITYELLDARSNQLARRLVDEGVGPDTVVGLALPRGSELVVAILATLKAGGAYLPLDLSYPPERLGFMLDDTAPVCVLTTEEGLDRLPAGHRFLALDAPDTRGPLARASREPGSSRPEPPRVAPEHAAYIIYTSGSTGAPKGVVIEHRSAVTFLFWARDVFEADELAGVLASTSVCFDLSIFEIFAPLSFGGTVILAQSALELPTLPHAARVRLVNTVPSAMAALVGTGLPAGVRTVNLAGEPLRHTLVADLYATGHVQRVLNLYGPSEDTTYSTWAAVGRDEPTPPIGRPIWNTRAHVLDERLQPAPVGVAGDLYLAGDGLARGYQRRSGLTAERFVPDPFGAPGARMYRTGDRVRWRDEGELDFLGRTDHQVKIRGYRVELGEIESRLRAQAGVRDAIVVARGDGDYQQLIAYVIGDAAGLNTVALTDALRQQLPAFMMPAAIVVLDAWPLTPNGKVDRKALPASDRAAPVVTGTPRTRDEAILCGLFADVLGVPAVGVDDDFFQCGGHSLLAMRLVSRVRAVMGVELAIRTVFQAPTVRGLARRLQRVATSGPPPLVARRRPAAVPASYAQQRLWFLDQLGGRTSGYTTIHAARLRGPLDRGALARALATIVARHEALRTSFADGDDGPVQIVAPSAEVPIVFQDLQGVAASEQHAAVSAALGEERAQRFDLRAAPLLRIRLLQLGPEEHVFVRVFHHIATDGWSLAVFNKELSQLYAAYRAGNPDPLPPLPVQYADFTLWQREWSEGRSLDRSLAYWREQLAGVPEQLDLPADRPRGTLAPSAALHHTTLDADALALFKRVTEAHGATLFMGLLTGLGALLARHTGQTDFVVGAPIANRQAAQLAGLIGFFVNTLPLRVRVPRESCWTTLLADVRRTAVDAYQHQDVPFERIVDAVAPARRLDATPLFQVMLTLQNTPAAPQALAGVTVTPVEDHTRAARNDLQIFATERAGQLQLDWLYDNTLFDGWRVAQLADHFTRLLQAFATEPLGRIADAPLLDAAERRRLLTAWNETATPIEAPATLTARFSAQAARTPNAVAVVSDTGELTFAELERRATRLACALRARGVGPETRVGLCAERSLAMAVGVFGVLKAGGAYVPILPALPRARQEAMLVRAGAVLVLTDGCDTALAQNVPVMVIDAESPDDDGGAADAATLGAVEPEQAAYVLFTSGSTGEPKGVVVEHRQVVNYHDGFQARAQWAPGLRCAMVQPLSVDASVTTFYGSLLTGAQLHLVSETTALDAEAYAAYAARHHIDVLKLAPSHLAALRAAGATAPLPARCLVLGGEPMRPEFAAALCADASCDIFNQYGPTETTVGVTIHQLQSASGTGSLVPIGRPLANVRAYVVDDAGEPVPVGVFGELLIGGSCVARGYLNTPGLTAARFVPDPWGAPGARLYRTGDRARWRPDGELEFLGRTDDQVKVRGFRVELGEIAATLRREPGVEDALVVTHGEGDALRLTGYVVRGPATTGASDAEFGRALLDAVRLSLPPYMVPASLVVLDTWPRTPHGKVDRGALPAPEPAAPLLTRGPRTTDEEILCELFADVLGLAAIGVDDDFFLHGGHSLLATRLVSRIRATLGAELAIRTVFEAPTVRALAERLRRTAPAKRPPLTAAPRPPLVPASYAQRRLWFLDQLQEQSTEYNMFSAWRLRGPLDCAAMTRAVQAIVARHESLRTRFVERDGEIFQAIDPAAPIAVRIDDLSALGADSQRSALMAALAQEAERPFDLARGPLIRARILRLGPADHVLVQVIHHIVSDGWSRAVINRELAVLYEAFHEGRPDPLPPLPVQYADVALWQHRYLDDAGLAEELEYWRRQLQGIPDGLDLPMDRPRPAHQTFDAGVCVTPVPPDACAAVKQLAQAHHATLYMVLLSAFAVLLSRYSDQDDLLVGSPVANRRDVNLEELVGNFVNSLVLRVRVDRTAAFTDLIAQVRNSALDAYKHQDMPFERLVEELAPRRSLSTSPIVQVLFAVQNVPDQPLALHGLTVETLQSEADRARWDLEAYVRESAGQLTVSWVYNSNLFDHWRIEQMARHFIRVIEAVTGRPDTRVGELDVLTDEERRAITDGSNRGPAVPAERTRVEAAFEEWASRTPEAMAVLATGDRLTYRELSERATELALRLRALGAGPGAVVGIAMRRSPWMVAGILAVLKSGAAYLPLDTGLPRARLQFVLRDAGVLLLLTDAVTRASVDGCGALLVDVDEHDSAAALEGVVLDTASPDPDAPAYVIYTSGSTGTPKGVAISHRSLMNILSDIRVRLGVTPASRVFALTNVAFDIAATELLLPLTSGASCWVAGATLAAGEPVIRELVESGCAIAQATPTGWRALLDLGWRGHGRVTALCAGEPLTAALAQELLHTCASVWNLYGPTETAIYSTAHQVASGSGSIPIGHPVANTRTFVLDPCMRPVPHGVIGELFIGGDGVAIGYVNRPGLTASAFVPDPFGDTPGGRLYRTGDLVRSRPDGVLEFVGRRDHQVKVRGFRIELGEIEAALAAQPGVRECVVVPLSDAMGDGRLVSYVVPDGALPGDPRSRADDLKRRIREHLPEYMVPTTVVWLTAFPLTATGKIDRKRLPVPDFESDRPPLVAPQTAVEHAVVNIWREVIGREDIGVHDDFFDLGGHSLTAIKIMSRVWRDLGVDLPLHVIFERPVLADMAAYIAECQRNPSQFEPA